MPKDMSEYRKEIDRIDDEIIRLLNERSKSVIEIGKIKKEKNAFSSEKPQKNWKMNGMKIFIMSKLNKKFT